MTKDSDSSIAIIKHFLINVRYFKYFYIICLVIFITAAYLFNSNYPKVYEVQSSIGPVQNDASSILSSNKDLFLGLKTLQTNKTLENDINNLVSFPTVTATITNMNLEIGYFLDKPGLFRQTIDLYTRSPFIVVMDKSHVQPVDVKFRVLFLSDSTFRLIADENKVKLYNYLDNQIVSENNIVKIDSICRFNETIKNKNFRFSVSFQKEYYSKKVYSEDIFYFMFYHLDYLAMNYINNLKVESVSPETSTIAIKFKGHNIEKIVNFLNSYIATILEENLAKKNKIARSTIKFIDSQISDISDSLILSESKLKNYRSANQVMDLSFQGKSIYDKLAQIETERATLQIQQRYYNYIINNFKTSKDMSGVVPPSSMNVQDPIMNQLITELLALYSQRSGILSNNTEKNLFLGQIDNKIKIQKQTIIENVTNNLNTLSLSLNELNYRSDKLSKEITELPKTELNMVSMQRKFNLNDVIYTFLLQKRSEAAITMASNYPDYEIIEAAREFTKRVKMPRTKLDYLFSLFLALLIPSSYIYLRSIFNNKITSTNDIDNLLYRSSLGNIYHNTYKSEAVVIDFPKSAISETFRNLRSNLILKLKSEKSKVILITSSQPGDGKSFVSFNLAASIASVGYKTIIIDCDLRMPTLHSKFKLDNSDGLSNYMVKKVPVSNIILTTFVENLSFIPAGPILPNPSELIESGVLDDLISRLREEFEYIIIDTSPVGIVSDASQMMKYASQILLVSRLNYTRKDIFANAINGFKLNKVSNYDVVFNGLSMNTSPYRHYSSYYLKK